MDERVPGFAAGRSLNGDATELAALLAGEFEETVSDELAVALDVQPPGGEPGGQPERRVAGLERGVQPGDGAGEIHGLHLARPEAVVGQPGEALEGAERDLVVVCGSLQFVGHVRTFLRLNTSWSLADVR